MTGGSRSKSGCFTCRIRKKKCDERWPVCTACESRQITCYGYEAPLPNWATSQPNWNLVRTSQEARNLQALAQTHYRVIRKLESRHDEVEPGASTTVNGDESIADDIPGENLVSHDAKPASPILCSNALLRGSSIWQLEPGTIWWDSRLNSLAVVHGSSSKQHTRLIMIFSDVIHAITHAFYPFRSNRDRSWFLNRLISNEALLYAALAVSACFERSLIQSPRINQIGIDMEVRALQSASVRRLREDIEVYTAFRYPCARDQVLTGIRLVDTVLNLANLEIFSMLEGCWMMHHNAARAILNHIEISATIISDGISSPEQSAIGKVLRSLPPNNEQRRTVEFCITNFVWFDVIATSTFGLAAYQPCAFDYLPLLQSREIRPHEVMGCRGIMTVLAEIVRLEHWWLQAQSQTEMGLPDARARLALQYQQLVEKLELQANDLEGEDQSVVEDSLSKDSIKISIVWAYAAYIYLQVVVASAHLSSKESLQFLVAMCLKKLELLPPRLIIRVCWPFTISGCMARRESQQQRFRRVLHRTLEDHQAPGISWKGLIVMEECWRLQQIHTEETIDWRQAMSSLKARVLLI